MGILTVALETSPHNFQHVSQIVIDILSAGRGRGRGRGTGRGRRTGAQDQSAGGQHGRAPTVTRPPPPALPADFESQPQEQKIKFLLTVVEWGLKYDIRKKGKRQGKDDVQEAAKRSMWHDTGVSLRAHRSVRRSAWRWTQTNASSDLESLRIGSTDPE